MQKKQIIDKIIEVLARIQEQGAFLPIALTPESHPVTDLTEFDSHLWVTALTLITTELDVKIPLNVNVFLSEDGNEILNISQIADRILELIPSKGRK